MDSKRAFMGLVSFVRPSLAKLCVFLLIIVVYMSVSLEVIDMQRSRTGVMSFVWYKGLHTANYTCRDSPANCSLVVESEMSSATETAEAEIVKYKQEVAPLLSFASALSLEPVKGAQARYLIPSMFLQVVTLPLIVTSVLAPMFIYWYLLACLLATASTYLRSRILRRG